MPALESLKVVYFGTPPFAAEVLHYLVDNGVNVAAIVTQPDRPSGRGEKLRPPAVKAMAQKLELDIPIHQPEKASSPEFSAVLEELDADIFVVVAYGEIVKQHLLDMPKRACLNLHASLLPKYRGAAPIQRCIMEGEKESGVTVMHMAMKMDSGDIIKMVKVPIPQEMTSGQLEEELCTVGKRALLDVLREFAEGEPSRVVQDHSQVTFAAKVNPIDGLVTWENSAQATHDQIRGVTPRPGAWCKVLINGDEKRLKIWQSRVVEREGQRAGEIIPSKNEFLVACREGVVALDEVQLEGKRRMNGADLIRGYGPSLQMLAPQGA